MQPLDRLRRILVVDDEKNMRELLRDLLEMEGFSADLAAASDKIGHDKLAANWELDGFRAPERWWFKS
mgnify:CR=1 FL=1